MASIEILDKGINGKERFKVSYDIRTPDNKRHRKSKTFKPGVSKRVVNNFKRQMENEYNAGQIVDITKRTLDDFAEEYFDYYTINLAPTTRANYHMMYYNPVNGLQLYFGKMYIDKITPLHIQNYIRKMLAQERSPKTIKNYIHFMHAMFERAIRLNYLQHGCNPAKEVDLPKITKPKIEAYTMEELKILLRLLNDCGDDLLNASVQIIIGTGIRRSELCGLKIKNYDKEKQELEITEAVVHTQNKNIVKSPKSDAGNRTISLPSSVAEIINRRIRTYQLNKLKSGKSFHDSGYLISLEDGSPLSPCALSGRYERFLKKHSEEIRYLSLHKLRHTFASIAISNGMDIKALQETLGHSDCCTTLNTYSHGYKSAKQKQAHLLDENIFKEGIS